VKETQEMKRDKGFEKKRIASGSWIVDAREHIKNWYNVDSPKKVIDYMIRFKQSADWSLVEMVAAAMDEAYNEGKERR